MARRSWSVVLAVVALGCGDHEREAAPAANPRALAKRAAPATTIKIAGTVIDQTTGDGVHRAIVQLGDAKATTDDRGAFELAVAPGNYRVSVSDPTDRLLMIGLQDRVRLDEGPRAELIAPDQGLMPTVDATSDIANLELVMTPAAIVKGIIVSDIADLSDAVVRVRPAQRTVIETRPARGSDVAQASANGRFTLHVLPGMYVLEVSHPRYAGSEEMSFMVQPGQELEVSPTLVPGCIVSGRVVQADGTPAHDGAIEKLGPTTFGPVGNIAAGGTFRWTTTSEGDVTLRAWPWQSPPSQAKTFHCKNGKRYANEVLNVPDEHPDISGTVVDARGNPVPLAFVDIAPLDPVPAGLGASQQERADAGGTWHVYEVPPGRYRIQATAPGRGVIETTIKAPRQDLRLQLGGTGRIAGTMTQLVAGAFELSFSHCGGKDDPLPIANEARIVIVSGGRFTIDNVPACALSYAVRWRDQVRDGAIVVEPDRAAHLALDLGAPRKKTVHGTIRDRHGKPVAAARITALINEQEATTVRSDDAGRYTLETKSGAQLVAGDGDRAGHAVVGRANVANEQIDLVLDDQ